MPAQRTVDVLLVGGGVASARCARTLRRAGIAGTILLVGEEAHAPYNRPPLSKELLRGEVDPELVAAEPARWYERHRVELLTGVPVADLDPQARRASLADGTIVAFGQCLLATGAAPRHLPVGGERALTLRTLDDALALRASAAGRRVTIVGGGFIGVEASASLAAAGSQVSVLQRAGALWSGALGSSVDAWARRVLAGAGVEVRLGTEVASIQDLDADVVLAAVGVTPRAELAEAAGIACDDGIVTDTAHATSAPNVWAAGDAARVDGLRVEHWHAAREGGERAALAMLGQPLPPASAPWVFSEFAGQMLDVVGVAPAWDDELVLGDAGSDRFAVAYLIGGRVAQLAVVNGVLDVGAARALVATLPAPSALPAPA